MSNSSPSIGEIYDTDKSLILIPIRSFEEGKSRFGAISPHRRRQLIEDLASGVVSSIDTTARRVVVTATSEVGDWAKSLGCQSLVTRSSLNHALREAADEFGTVGGYGVVMGDIALPSRSFINEALSSRLPLIACDRLRRGTSILHIPFEKVIDFKFGVDSFKAHLDVIIKNFRVSRVYSAKKESIDIDDFDDLLALQKNSTLTSIERERITKMIKMISDGENIDL
ncbi:MAG: hypothetical protein M0019_07840 [Actinomycetota bacterium]|nr:hypothetical protein [Actinomycetota bacterium]